MSNFRVVAAVLLAMPGPVAAQIVFEDAPPKVTPANIDNTKSDWDKIECRAQDLLGSRLERHKVCLTKWQWWLFEHEERDEIRRWQILGDSRN